MTSPAHWPLYLGFHRCQSGNALQGFRPQSLSHPAHVQRFLMFLNVLQTRTKARSKLSYRRDWLIRWLDCSSRICFESGIIGKSQAQFKIKAELHPRLSRREEPRRSFCWPIPWVSYRMTRLSPSSTRSGRRETNNEEIKKKWKRLFPVFFRLS